MCVRQRISQRWQAISSFLPPTCCPGSRECESERIRTRLWVRPTRPFAAMRSRSGLNGNTQRVSIPGVEAFEKLVALLNYPMFVVTTEAGGVTAGCLVGFASQHPPRFLVGLSMQNHT